MSCWQEGEEGEEEAVPWSAGAVIAAAGAGAVAAVAVATGAGAAYHHHPLAGSQTAEWTGDSAAEWNLYSAVKQPQ